MRIFSIALLVWLVLTHAQQGAIITGVVRTESGEPVVGAVVTALAPKTPYSLSVFSNASGQFSFDALPADRFTISASKPAYVTTVFGANWVGGPGLEIAVAPGQRQEGVNLTLVRGAVITGVISDDQARRLAGVTVNLLRVSQSAAGPQIKATQSGQTNDLGRFRFFGVEPGSFAVAATVTETMQNGQEKLNAARVDYLLGLLAKGVRQVPANTPVPQSANSVNSYVPTYYPGTVISNQAAIVSVSAGQEVDSSFTLLRASTQVITGSVTGAPPGVPIRVTLEPRGGFEPPSRTTARSISVAEGELFSFRDVNPGSYTLVASALPRGAVSQSGAVACALAEVNVDRDPIAGLLLQLQPAISISGVVAFDTASPAPTVRAIVGLVSTREDVTKPTSWVVQAQAGPDGRFQLSGIPPGRYKLAAVLDAGTESKWTLSQVTFMNRDATDAAIDLSALAAERPSARIVFSDRMPQLEGFLRVQGTGDGSALSLYRVLIFPTDQGRWTSDARSVRVLRLATDFHYASGGLPVGDYFVGIVAVPNGTHPDDELKAVEILRSVAPTAVKVSLPAGGKVTQDLAIRR